ncbi:MAG: hypothetical protein M1828_000770 [Chrysothrix sp. TS-e1954]|nr:MAG: hypothetical protein M1828_000770 [Chrysothrix sp. TS-e1954]
MAMNNLVATGPSNSPSANVSSGSKMASNPMTTNTTVSTPSNNVPKTVPSVKNPVQNFLLGKLLKPGETPVNAPTKTPAASKSVVAAAPVVDIMKTRFTDMTLEQKSSLLEHGPSDPTAEIDYCSMDEHGNEAIFILTEKANRRLLMTFSSVARDQLQDDNQKVLLLRSSATTAMRVLFDFMVQCCKSKRIPELDVWHLSAFQWIRLWNCAKAMGFDIVLQQLKKHMWRDAYSLDFDSALTAWKEAKDLGLAEPEKVLKAHLHDYAWNQHGALKPSDLEKLQELAPEASFTEAAVKKTTRFLYEHVPMLNPHQEVKRMSGPLQARFNKEFAKCEAEVKVQVNRKIHRQAQREWASKQAARSAQPQRPKKPVPAAEVKPTVPQFSLRESPELSQKQRKEVGKQQFTPVEPSHRTGSTSPSGESAQSRSSSDNDAVTPKLGSKEPAPAK